VIHIFEWLNDYQKLEDEISYLEYNLDRTKAELKRWVYGDLQEVRLTKDSEGAKVEERIEAIEYELAHRMNDMHDLTKLINTFKGLENQILKMKYVEGMTLDKVAEELNYSTQYIYNKHAAIKDKISYAYGT
jgi:DNA-directed RNA polymerase specialized sigma subunit